MSTDLFTVKNMLNTSNNTGQHPGYGSISVERPHYEQEQFNTELKYAKPKIDTREIIREKVCSISPKKCILSVFPIITWLSQYDVKKNLIPDIVSGCTVAVMHIPQGMGYAMLANVPPIVGIYTAFFPVLIYFIFGTSRHNSMGTFAVVNIMVGKAVLAYSDFNFELEHPGADPGVEIAQRYSPVQVVTAIAFLIGLIQFGMYVSRLGIISSLLSEALVSGFTTGASIHVLTSQVKDLLGIKLKSIEGNFQIIFTFGEIFKQLGEGNFNWAAIIISAVAITILVINNDHIKPAVAKKCSFPIPIELIIVIAGTCFSKFLFFEETFGVKPIGTIPTGLPGFQLPPMELLSTVIIDAFTIAMVSYTVSLSMGLIFAQRYGYEIDGNQELLAMGLGNVFGSMFSCLPLSASLSRSTIQATVGGKTQIASIVSCSILCIVLLWVGPFFEPLPRCVLSSIIVVALKSLFMQSKDLLQFWKLSRLDAIVWIFTFLTVVIVAIDIGLAVGIVLSLASIFIRGMKPYTCLLGHVKQTDFYLDVKRYKTAEEIEFVKIFHYCGSLNFASRAFFKSELLSAVQVDLPKQIKLKSKADANSSDIKFEPLNLKTIILDFSAVSYIDPSSVTSLKLLIKDFQTIGINVYIAGSSCPTYELMRKCGLLECQDSFKYFPSIHDAVHYTKCSLNPISVIATNSNGNL